MSEPEQHGQKASMGAHPQLIEVSDEAPLLDEPAKAKAEATDEIAYVPPNGYWPLVIIAGRYGFLGCENKQTLKYNNILRSTVFQEAKKYFGLCPYVINYYDDHGHLIETE